MSTFDFKYKYYGARKHLVDLLRLYNNYDFYENPSINDINNQTFEDKLIIVYISNVDLISDLEKINDIIILFENNEIIRNFFKKNMHLTKNLIKVDAEFILNKLSEKYNLKFDPINKLRFLQLSDIESIGNLIEKYIVLEDIDDLLEISIKKNNFSIDVIPFLRQKMFTLKNWTSDINLNEFGKFSLDKKNFLEAILYKLEYIFRKTGNQTLPFFFISLCKILN